MRKYLGILFFFFCSVALGVIEYQPVYFKQNAYFPSGAYITYGQNLSGAIVVNPSGQALIIQPGPSGNVLQSDGLNFVSGPNPAGFTNPMTQSGDMIYEDATLTPAALNIGLQGQIMMASGGFPSWQSGSAFTDSTGGADGIIVSGGLSAVINSMSISQNRSDSATNGYLDSADFDFFANKQSAIVGTPFTFAGFDISAAVVSVPHWSYSPGTLYDGGLSTIQNTDTFPDAGGGNNYAINSWTTKIDPTGHTVNQFPQMLTIDHEIDTIANSNYHIEQVTGLNYPMNYNGNGSITNVTQFNQTFANGNTTNVGSINGLNLHTINLQNNSGASLGFVNGINLAITNNQDAIMSGTINALNVNVTSNGIMNPGAGIDLANLGGTLTSGAAYTSLVNANFQIQSGAVILGTAGGFGDGTNVQSGAYVGNMNSFGAFVQIQSGATVQGYTAYTASTQVYGDMPSAGVSIMTGNINTTAQLNNLGGIGISTQLQSGANIIGGANTFSDGTNIQSGATVASYNSISLNPNFQAGSNVTTNVTGLSISPALDGTIPQYHGIQINGNGAATQVTGVNIDVGSITSPNQKTALAVSDGMTSLNSNYDTGVLVASPGFVQNNYLGGVFHIAAGFPVSNTLAIGNNLGITLLAEDDMGPDASGLGLGFLNDGLVNQTAVATGKTVDTINQMAAGFSIPALAVTGGSVSNATMFNALGALPQGGTLNITNMFGFKASSSLCAASPTNCWGFYNSATTSDNWFSKNLIIDGSTGQPTSAGVKLEINSGIVKMNGNNIFMDSGSILNANVVNGVNLQLNGATSGVISQIASAVTLDYQVAWPPAQGNSGEALFNDGAGNLYWASAAGGSGSFVNPMTASGDIIYNDSALAPAALPIGGSGYVLTVSGGLPTWQPPVPAGSSYGVSAVATDYTLALTDQIIIADATASAFTLTFPPASSLPGKFFTISKVTQANQVLLAPNGADTLINESGQVLNEKDVSITLISDGISNWIAQ